MAKKKTAKAKHKPKDTIGREPLFKLPRPPLDRIELLKFAWTALDELAGVRAAVRSLRDSCDVRFVDGRLETLEYTLEKLYRKIKP